MAARIRYQFWRWLAPRLPSRDLRVQAWDRKWRLWHQLYGPHQLLWDAER